MDEGLSSDQTPRPGASSEVEELRTLLYTDDLTGLYNRRFFRHCVDEQKTWSDSTNSPFALLMFDVDHFKQINDTYGHAVGDAALIKIARVLKDQLRDLGWVFRYAGDEFVAIVRNCNQDHARSICSHLLKSIATCLNTTEPGFPLRSVSLSIGFAIYPEDTNVISDLLQIADQALYASKQAGRNCFHSGQEVTAMARGKAGEWPVPVHCQLLIGREAQREKLQHYFSECKNGRGRLVFIKGEAGIGKSRLLHHFIRRQRTSDYHILYGQCSEGTLIHPYAPARDALKKGFEAKDPATVNIYKQLDEHYRRELIGLVPQFDRYEKQPLPPAQSGDRYFLLESILLLLQGLAHQLPTLMVLEDIHWSDEASLNLLYYLARNIKNDRILLLATFREEEAIHSSLPGIIQNMSRENLFQTIELKPLDPHETGMMVQEIFKGYSIPSDFKHWIHQETEGNPFYIEELVKLLLEEGYIQRFGEEIELRKPDKFVLPYSIRALIQRRVSRLSETLQRLLGFASIIGYEFDLDILVRLIEENEGYLLDLLEQLVRLQLIREISAGGEERFAFTHNKIRDVIYEEMGVIKRKKFHRRVAEILEHVHEQELELYVEELAHHYEQGGVIDKAFHYSLDAGKKALQIHAYHDAQQHFDRCFRYLNLVDNITGEKLVDLYISKGMVMEALGCWEEAIRCYEGILSIPDTFGTPHLQPDGWNHLSRVYYKREDFTRSLQYAQKALEVSREKNYRAGMAVAYYNLGKNYWRLCKYDSALEQMKEAVETSKEQDDLSWKAKLLNSTGIIYLEQSRFDHALQSFQDALELFQERTDKPGIIECLVNVSIIRHLQGNLEEARQHIVNAFALAQETGDPFSLASCAVNQAELEARIGHYEVAARLNERAGRIYNELNHSLGQTYFLQNEALLNLMKGKLEAAMESIEKALGIAEEKNLKKRYLEILTDKGTIHYFLGDYCGTLATLENIVSLAEEVGDMPSLCTARLKMGFVYWMLQDRELALEQWTQELRTPGGLDPYEVTYWRATVRAFTSFVTSKQEEGKYHQQEMLDIAQKTQDRYLLTSCFMMMAYQSEIAEDFSAAMDFLRQAEANAISLEQELWIPRIRLKLYELQYHCNQPVESSAVQELLPVCKEQKQNLLIHHGYKLLQKLRPSEERLKEWQQHLAQWLPLVPEKYHSLFSSAVH